MNNKMVDRAQLRSTLLGALFQMGEIEQTQADELAANPNADLELIRLNFESLTVIDFCLRIETSTGIAIDPDEMAEFSVLSELETALMARNPVRPEIS